MDLEAFKNWAIAQGQVGKYTDGKFVGECVSLINQYLGRVYGISAGAWGNAKDWATNSSVAQYFDRVGNLQLGDIVVYGPNFGGGYGHIGIYLGNNKILDQNGADDGKIRVNNLYPGYSAILRRKGSDNQQGDDMSDLADNYFVQACAEAMLGRTADGDKNLLNNVGRPKTEVLDTIRGYPEAVARRKKASAPDGGGDFVPVTDTLYKKKG